MSSDEEGGGALDDELYDEDGLLRQDDSVVEDKSKLINSVQSIFKLKKNGRGLSVRREAVKDVQEFVVVKRHNNKASSSSSLNKLLETVKASGDGGVVEKVSTLVKTPSLKPVSTLETPLEKPAALKAKRVVLYDQTKKDVSRFNAAVYHNRAASQLVFPLTSSGGKVTKDSGRERLADSLPMTPLEEEMATVLHGPSYVAQRKADLAKPKGPSEEEAYSLSVEEALVVHSEMARLRASTSYQMSKAKRQNKIKSKSYHRLLRKEKIKRTLKDFEVLQRVDPEGALAKLEELNVSRVTERMSLKHRNTSKWAKMQAVRAKYNKDSRIALGAQLKISKELSQKVQESSGEEEDEMDLELPPLVRSSFNNNPWMLGSEVQNIAKMALYYTGYKKLWEQINNKKKQNQEEIKEDDDEVPQFVEKEKAQEEDKVDGVDEEEEATISQEEEEKPTKKKRKKRKKKKKRNNNSSSSEVKEVAQEDFTELDLDVLIDTAEEKIRSGAASSLKKMEKEEKVQARVEERKRRREAAKEAKSIKKSKRGDADEIQELEVDEEEQIFHNQESEPISSSSKPLAKASTATIIDPSKFLKISKSKKKKGAFDGDALAKIIALGDESSDDGDDDDSQRAIIAEAFEDDDVVSDFRLRKADEVASGTPKDIDLSLPGWGEWGGKGILDNPKKKKKFIIKAPLKPPRKDAHLSHVILNEEAGPGLGNHLVRSVPFPFKSVKDYEASLRCPLGRSWMPERAVKDLTAPKVITSLGSVIQPLSEEVLVNSKNKKKALDLKVPSSIKRLARVK